MISISRLLFDAVGPGDSLRYSKEEEPVKKQIPIVVWNCTRSCNLKCVHCYSSSSDNATGEILDTEQAKAFINGLAEFGVQL